MEDDKPSKAGPNLLTAGRQPKMLKLQRGLGCPSSKPVMTAACAQCLLKTAIEVGQH